jgi:hypothetical protein
MCDTKVTAKARVRVTIDIPVGDSWGEECDIAQVHRQAKESALGMLRNSKFHELQRAVIVGEPVVTAILVEPEVRS